MSSELSSSGVRQPDTIEPKDHPQPAAQQTLANQAESTPQDPQASQNPQQPPTSVINITPPRTSSNPSAAIVPPTIVESPIEQNRAQPVLVAPGNVSVVTLDAPTPDHLHRPASQPDMHTAGPSQTSHSGAENGRVVQLGNGVLYGHRHPSLNRPQTAPVNSGGRPRTGESTLRPRTGDSMMRSTIDWVVPVEDRSTFRHTVEERLAPTLDHAIRERDKLKLKAKTAKWSINTAAALQVFLGSMTTGLSAIRLDGPKFGVATTVLGIFATLTGAFLARVRATDEPETSLIRAHDLDAFIRDCEAFRLDYGLDTGDKYNPQIEDFRRRFEMILGNLRAEAVKATSGPQRSGGAPLLDSITGAKQPLKQPPV